MSHLHEWNQSSVIVFHAAQYAIRGQHSDVKKAVYWIVKTDNFQCVFEISASQLKGGMFQHNMFEDFHKPLLNGEIGHTS